MKVFLYLEGIWPNIYIYIERERETERQRDRERETERERESLSEHDCLSKPSPLDVKRAKF